MNIWNRAIFLCTIGAISLSANARPGDCLDKALSEVERLTDEFHLAWKDACASPCYRVASAGLPEFAPVMGGDGWCDVGPKMQKCEGSECADSYLKAFINRCHGEHSKDKVLSFLNSPNFIIEYLTQVPKHNKDCQECADKGIRQTDDPDDPLAKFEDFRREIAARTLCAEADDLKKHGTTWLKAEPITVKHKDILIKSLQNRSAGVCNSNSDNYRKFEQSLNRMVQVVHLRTQALIGSKKNAESLKSGVACLENEADHIYGAGFCEQNSDKRLEEP